MSSFLKINGWAAPVAEDGADGERPIVGETAQAFSGAEQTNIRRRKYSYDLDFVMVSRTDGEALVALLEGRGHHWNFDGAATGGVNWWEYSSKGLGKTSGTLTRATATPSPKFGTAYGSIASGGTVTWTTGYTSGSTTLMVWVYDGAAWVHYIVRSDGAKWVDGVRNDAASTPFLTIASGVVTLGDSGSGATQKFDDLVVLGFAITTGMAAAFGTATSAFSDLPALGISGDAVETAIQAKVIDGVKFKRQNVAISGSLVAGYAVSATLVET